VAATGTTSSTATDSEVAELADHLARTLEARLLDPLEILLESSTQLDQLRRRVRRRARLWARQLLDGDERQATMLLARLVGALYPGDAPFDPPASWWSTPLGQVTARTVGHPAAATVTYAVAGAMLGVTRQGVHDLVRRGKLDRHPDGGVTVTSVRDRLRERRSARPVTTSS
jgi:hypothetical protein